MAEVITWEMLGVILRALRHHYGMTQEKLAETLGCTRSYLWRLEHSKRRPSRRFLRYIRAQFDLSADERRAFETFELMIEFDCNHWELEAVMNSN